VKNLDEIVDFAFKHGYRTYLLFVYDFRGYTDAKYKDGKFYHRGQTSAAAKLRYWLRKLGVQRIDQTSLLVPIGLEEKVEELLFEAGANFKKYILLEKRSVR